MDSGHIVNFGTDGWVAVESTDGAATAAAELSAMLPQGPTGGPGRYLATRRGPGWGLDPDLSPVT